MFKNIENKNHVKPSDVEWSISYEQQYKNQLLCKILKLASNS